MTRVKHSLASNPIRVVREKQNKTLQEFADLCGVHMQALYLNECGAYPNILPSVIRYMKYKLGLEESQLQFDYTRFVHKTREEFENRYSPYSLSSDPRTDHSPVVEWRQGLDLSRSGLVKALCVQPYLLSRVERGETPELPEQFELALLEVHFPMKLLQELKDRVEEFYYYKVA